MEAHKLQVKIFFESKQGQGPEAEAFIPVFHTWIKHHVLKELLVDTVNYAHVPEGPAVALIGHGSDYLIDDGEGRRGLLYSRKRDAPPAPERLKDAFRRAVHAAILLEKEEALRGQLRFRTDELLFRINDRLLAPNSEATFAALRPELETFCATLFGSAAYRLALAAKPKQLFAVRMTTETPADLATLLGRLGGPPDADGR